MTNGDKAPRKNKLSPPWKPGQSGNPKGRPKGSRNRVSVACDELLDGEAEKLTRKAIEMALAGDITAMRLCLERICPPRKDRPIILDLPKLETAADSPQAMSVIVAAVAEGEITPNEAQALAAMVETFRRTLETAELVGRVAALESKTVSDSLVNLTDEQLDARIKELDALIREMESERIDTPGTSADDANDAQGVIDK
jgi:hypothetical protein